MLSLLVVINNNSVYRMDDFQLPEEEKWPANSRVMLIRGSMWNIHPQKWDVTGSMWNMLT